MIKLKEWDHTTLYNKNIDTIIMIKKLKNLKKLNTLTKKNFKVFVIQIVLLEKKNLGLEIIILKII